MQGFRELVQLHLAHEADRKAARQQEDLRKKVAALEEGVAAAKIRLELADADLKLLQAERRSAEMDIQKLDDQRSKYRSQLMTAKTNEIYRTLISEIETSARAISEKETVVLQAMETSEKATAVMTEAKQDLARAESLRQAEERKLVADIEVLDQERAAAQARARELEPGVERTLLTLYRRIMEVRDGKGMALALASQCTECRMSVRPQEWLELQDPQVPSRCIGCKRILYRAESAQ